MNKLEEYNKDNLIQNPYSYTLNINVTEVISNINYTRDPEDGLILNSKFYLENTQSTRIYYCEDCKQFVYNLSASAKSLYLFILYNIVQGQDYLQINHEHYMSTNDISSINTYKSGLKELLRYNFIAATEYKTVFWLNPNLFFSGNRLKKFPKNITVTKTWEQ